MEHMRQTINNPNESEKERSKRHGWRLYKNPKFVETPRKHHAKSESNKKKGKEKEGKEMLKTKQKRR
jgi:hypothetical protein